MKERPILFSAPMVRALLEGSKTQTRRIFKVQPDEDGLSKVTKGPWVDTSGRQYVCPYGQTGDLIWAKETFFAYGRWEMRYSERKGRDERHFIDMTIECYRAYQFAADNPDIPLATRGSVQPCWYKRPAIFMPRIASRIQLEITGVRVERLKDISEEDALAEGVTLEACHPRHADDMGRRAYQALWESINGPESWAANPWVWVIEFRRISL